MTDTLPPPKGETVFRGIQPSSELPPQEKIGSMQTGPSAESHSVSLENQSSALKDVKRSRNIWESFQSGLLSLGRKIEMAGKHIVGLIRGKEPSENWQRIAVNVDGKTRKLYLHTGHLEEAVGKESARTITNLVRENLTTLIQLAQQSQKGKASRFYQTVENGERKVIKIKYDKKTGEVTVTKTFTAGGEMDVKKLVRFGVPKKLSLDNSFFVYKRPRELTEQKMPEMERKEFERGMRHAFKTWEKLTSGRNPVPNLVTMHKVTRADSMQKGILEPYYKGGSIDNHIAEPPITAEGYATRLKWAQEGAAALAGMHKKGYIHNDIKPENFLIDGKGHALLGDFGSATHIKEEPHGGTPTYWSPEVWDKGKRATQAGENATDVRKKNDVFAFGVSLFEVFYGPQANPLHLKHKEGISPEEDALARQEYMDLASNAHGIHDDRYNELTAILDQKIEEGDAMAQLIRRCINNGKRPSMTEVQQELKHIHILVQESPLPSPTS